MSQKLTANTKKPNLFQAQSPNAYIQVHNKRWRWRLFDTICNGEACTMALRHVFRVLLIDGHPQRQIVSNNLVRWRLPVGHGMLFISPLRTKNLNAMIDNWDSCAFPTQFVSAFINFSWHAFAISGAYFFYRVWINLSKTTKCRAPHYSLSRYYFKQRQNFLFILTQSYWYFQCAVCFSWLILYFLCSVWFLSRTRCSALTCFCVSRSSLQTQALTFLHLAQHYADHQYIPW